MLTMHGSYALAAIVFCTAACYIVCTQTEGKYRVYYYHYPNYCRCCTCNYGIQNRTPYYQRT